MRSRPAFALVASMWLVVGIAAVGLEIAWLARTHRLALANALEHTQSAAVAASGLEHARALLSRALVRTRGDALADPWRRLGDSLSARVGRAEYHVTLQDDAALLDVNAASETMLARLFVACGAEAREAAAAAARIADWRDGDGTLRALGAAREEYLAAQAPALPRNGPVQRIAELDDVLGLPAAWRCVRPLLSVGGAGLVNPNTADRRVLAALPGMNAQLADALVAHRSAGGRFREWRDLLAVAPAGLRAGLDRDAVALQRLLAFETNVVRVTSAAAVDGSPVRVTAEALMRRAGESVFVEWRIFW